MGLGVVPTKEEDVLVIAWTLIMGGCGLSISLQQLKTKVAKLTQIRATTFRNQILCNNWWY
jgi:hypothetical protein